MSSGCNQYAVGNPFRHGLDDPKTGVATTHAHHAEVGFLKCARPPRRHARKHLLSAPTESNNPHPRQAVSTSNAVIRQYDDCANAERMPCLYLGKGIAQNIDFIDQQMIALPFRQIDREKPNGPRLINAAVFRHLGV